MSDERVLRGALPVGDAVQSVHHLRLDPLPRLVRSAREFVREHARATETLGPRHRGMMPGPSSAARARG